MEFQIGHFFWLVFSLLFGAGYAFFLYSPGRRGTGMPHGVLFVLRLLGVAAITFLLFAPRIRSVEKSLEKPVIVLAQDNSASLTLGSVRAGESKRYSASVKRLYEQLSNNYQIDTLLIGDSVRTGFSRDLQDQSTNITSLFQRLRSLYAGRNVGAIILASDGLYNRGGDPLAEALSLRAPVYSVALGDTQARRDLRISNIHYNELIQAGNDFEISLHIEAYQSKGRQPRLAVYRGKELLFSKVVDIRSEDFRYSLPVILPAQPTGTSRYTVRIDAVSGEISSENNARDFYVRTQDLKKNILIVAEAPHPDISAIRQSLQATGSYKLDFSYAQDLKTTDIIKADLVILYQLPSKRVSMGRFLSLLKAKAIWYFLGAQSDLSAFSSMQGIFDVKAAATPLEVSATTNSSFQAFSFPDSLNAAIAGYGPLQVPFSDVYFKGNHYDLLHQKVGQFNTGRPLFSFSADSEPRLAFLGGEGMWRWRLQAFHNSGSHHIVDQLLNKAVQFLVVDTDKRRFRVYPSQQIYTSSEPVIINAELYDESLELVNKPDVFLTLLGASGNIFSYQLSRLNNSYIAKLGTLPAGEYTYKASTKLGNTSYKEEGKVLISAEQLESQEVRANHQLLYQLAWQSGGELFYPHQLEEIEKSISKNEAVRTVSYQDETVDDLINMKWFLGLICGLIFCEWFLRKRGGGL